MNEKEKNMEQTEFFVVHRIIQPLYERAKYKISRHKFRIISMLLPFYPKNRLHDQTPDCTIRRNILETFVVVACLDHSLISKTNDGKLGKM